MKKLLAMAAIVIAMSFSASACEVLVKEDLTRGGMWGTDRVSPIETAEQFCKRMMLDKVLLKDVSKLDKSVRGIPVMAIAKKIHDDECAAQALVAPVIPAPVFVSTEEEEEDVTDGDLMIVCTDLSNLD
jgi:hypothetical protein